MGSVFKLRVTSQEDALLGAAARFYGVTFSALVRDAVADAIAKRRRAKSRDEDGREPRDVDHNVRLMLTPAAARAIRSLSHGLALGPWVRLIVLDDVESGRAAARYGKGADSKGPETPNKSTEPAAA